MTLGAKRGGTPSDHARALIRRGRLYVKSARRSHFKYGFQPGRLVRPLDDRPVFVVGSPRSGTSFTAETLGRVPGFADLGELAPLKAAVAELYAMPPGEAARHVRRIVRWAQRVGQLAGLRPIEQTPESSHIIPAIASAFPGARFVHLVRDGRDSAASLIQLGWVRAVPDKGADDVGLAFGAAPRFWVEPERADEFGAASEATRAAWVWRRYHAAVLDGLDRLPGRWMRIRYEDLVGDPARTARELAQFLDAGAQAEQFVAAFGATRSGALGRWRSDLAPEQLADIEAEAGELLVRLGYARSS